MNNLPEDFDWNIYIKLNKDLSNIKLKSHAIKHYLKHGKSENRLYKIDKTNYPIDFNWKNYIILNPDLKCINELDALNHYLQFGKKEKRKYTDYELERVCITETYLKNRIYIHDNNINTIISGDFDYLYYYYFNKDIYRNVKNNRNSIYNHYINYGINEKRIIKNNLYFDKAIEIILIYNNKLFTEDCILSNMFNYCYEKELNIKTFNLSNYTIQTNIKYKTNYHVSVYNDYNSESFITDYTFDNELNLPTFENVINFDFILIIDFSNKSGGTSFFLNSIINKYKKYQTFLIVRNIDNNIKISINDEFFIDSNENFFEINKNNIIKVFVNHINGHSINFLQKIISLNKEITVITHDYTLVSNNSQPCYNDLINNIKTNKCAEILEHADKIITQNITNEHIFSKHIKDKQLIITPLPDFKDRNELISFDFTEKIKIAVIGCVQEIKGKLFLDFLIEMIKNKKLDIELIFLGSINVNYDKQYEYLNINEFNDLLKIHKPNLILETSIWPETYSYTLTLSMLTDLPILVLDKKFDSVIKDRLLNNYDKYYLFDTLKNLMQLIKDKKQNYLYTIKPNIYFNDFWDNYFITNKQIIENNCININKNNVSVFPIYFPQFHEIKENNISFYNKYSDIKNLNFLIKNYNIEHIETPNKSYYEFNNIEDYDLLNKNIAQKQIDLLKLYNFNGFAMYYYWFDINTITNENLIMKKCVDLFFNGEINVTDKKIFFIWANENWSNNPAFGNLNYKIENTYQNFDKIINNLIGYFKNKIYHKENNKPCLYIYHPWLISNQKITEFYTNLNNKCIENGFNGVKLYLNNFDKTYVDFENFYINFNYKNSNFRELINKQYYLDYKKYTDNPINNNCVQTLVFDFDNRARLVKPNKLELSTICINNTDYYKKKYIDKITHTNSNTLLINAWNEWGEKMSIEPSEQCGFYYLNMIYDKLVLLNDKIINKFENLFHKFKYKMSTICDDDGILSIHNKEKLFNNDYITHIHCYNLDIFELFFVNVIDNCLKETDIIVTFCSINTFIINKYKNILFLQIKNKGYDIGGKICCIKYIYDNNINFKNMFFLHSKSNNDKRNLYMMPLVKDVERIRHIKNLFLKNSSLLGVFPDLFIDGNKLENKKMFAGTNDYRNELLDFLECNKKPVFVEGNVMVLNKKVIDYVFYGKTKIFYSILNDETSIDLNWMKFKYYLNKGLDYISNDNILNCYLKSKNNFLTNDFQCNPTETLRDCMIEHVFERIWLNVILSIKGNYVLLNI